MKKTITNHTNGTHYAFTDFKEASVICKGFPLPLEIPGHAVRKVEYILTDAGDFHNLIVRPAEEYENQVCMHIKDSAVIAVIIN